MAAFTAPPIRPQPPRGGFRRADILFDGIEQAGPSFEGRVFLNKPDATEETSRTSENGYAGAFHVYGYGRLRESREGSAAGAPDEALAPIGKRVVATEPVRAALAKGDELTVTVVPRPPEIAIVCRQVSVVFDEGER